MYTYKVSIFKRGTWQQIVSSTQFHHCFDYLADDVLHVGEGKYVSPLTSNTYLIEKVARE